MLQLQISVDWKELGRVSKDWKGFGEIWEELGWMWEDLGLGCIMGKV